MTHLPIDFTPQIVGIANNSHVATPIELPRPLIFPAKLQEREVQLSHPQQFIRSSCLVIPSSVIPMLLNSSPPNSTPAAISLTSSMIHHAKNTLKLTDRYDPNSLVYELEMFPYKTPPHASLYRGWVLLRKQQRGDELFRPCNQFQIVVKKFRVADADARVTADNVYSEFSVLQYLGADRNPHAPGQIICLTDGEFYYSVMKFCGYDLGSYVFGAPAPLGEEKVRHLFRQLLKGMRYLQSRGICHRDLSIENLVYDEETHTLSIIDYGMALVLPRYPDGRPYLIPPSGPLGKKHYMPPEILENTESFDGFRSDSWNLGIILFLVLTKKYPLQFANMLCQYFRIVATGRLRELMIHWKLQLSATAMDLIFHMLQPVPAQRYSLDEIENHPWVREGTEIPVGLSKIIPSSAAEVREEEKEATAEEDTKARDSPPSELKTDHL